MALWRAELPAVVPHYAVKCNPDPKLLRLLVDAGVQFDCASKRELLEVAKLGSVADQIVYANPCKSARDLEAARGLGAPTTVIDSEEEVGKLRDYAGGALVRIAVDDTSSAMPFSSKFGARPAAVEGIARAAAAAGIPLHGVSFHVGSGGKGGASYKGAIEAAWASVLKLREAGHGSAATIDIGGGYLPDAADFKAKAAVIRGAMESVATTGPTPRWIAEPGRFFATGAFDFFVQVIGKKKMSSANAQQGYAYTIDDSVYGQFTNILFDHAQPTWVRVRTEPIGHERPRSPGVLFGRTCDSVDVIARATAMEELEVGDWLWFPAMGAYTRATASEFNGFPRPRTFVAEEGADLAESSFAWRNQPFQVSRLPPVSARAFWQGA